MKKIITMVVCVMTLCLTATAQNYLQLNVTDIENHQVFQYCQNQYDSIVIVKDATCNQTPYWGVGDHYGLPVFEGHFDQITLTPEMDNTLYVTYEGCVTVKHFEFHFLDDEIQEPWDFSHGWKRYGTSVTLEAYAPNVTCEWSTGQTGYEITVSEPGTYWVHMYNQCSELWDTIQVRDNVEIYRAGVDPATNKNRVLWQTTPEQATYVSSVKVERDGMIVGTVPYTDGEFLDNIGSENAARVYRITAIASDGTECPIPSYQFGTFNTIISPDIANPNLMNFTWEDPFIEEGSPYSVVAYRIGRFNENTGEFVAIDQLSAQVHLGKYNMDLFEGDYGIVAAVFSDAKNRDYEELAFSNRSDSGIMGIGEQDNETVAIYPNPAKGRFTVEGTGTMTVTNTLGQTILTREIDGKETVELPQGLYFVKLGEATRKVVVE